jgi:hypothetical protein
MRKALLSLCAAVVAALSVSSTALASPFQEPCRADYQIQLRYDEQERRVQGRESIRYTNTTRDDIPDLQFHLYWNAFANDRSTHLVESGGVTRGGLIK